MRFFRIFSLTVWMLLTVVSATRAEHLLQESSATATRATVELEVRGHLRIQKTRDKDDDSKEPATKKLKLAVDGKLIYHQRTLPDQQGSRSAVRYYEQSEARVVVDDRLFQPQLKTDRRLVRVDVAGEQIRFRCPQGPLSREELEVVATQGNCLLLHRILPDKEVSVGQAWGLDGNAVAPIFGLDTAYSSGLQAKLKSVKDNVARIEISGPLDGSVDGVASRIDCEGDLYFDLQRRQITMFDVSFDESRNISGGQPGIEAHSHLRLTIKPTSTHPELKDASIAQFPSTSAELLRYVSPNGTFHLVHSPQWRVVRDSAKNTTFRLLNGGDVVAQGNLSKLKNLPAEEKLTLKTFEQDVRQTLEKLEGQVVSTEEAPLESGLHMLRVIGQGKVQEVDVQWVYLHLANAEGARISCVFTMEQKQAERFEGADLALLNGLRFTEKTAKAGETK